MKDSDDIRELYFSDDFWEFYHLQTDKVKNKFNYVFGIVRKEKVITTKFIKRLVNTDLYEMRISVLGSDARRATALASVTPQ